MIDVEKTITDELRTWSKDSILAMIKVLEVAKMGLSPRSKTLADSQIKKYLESQDGKITRKQSTFIYELVLPGYAQWVEVGRKPGKMPPSDPINKWLKRKGINLKYSYPIRRSIGEKGLKGTYFTNAFWERESILTERLTQLLVPAIEYELFTYAKKIGYK